MAPGLSISALNVDVIWPSKPLICLPIPEEQFYCMFSQRSASQTYCTFGSDKDAHLEKALRRSAVKLAREAFAVTGDLLMIDSLRRVRAVWQRGWQFRLCRGTCPGDYHHPTLSKTLKGSQTPWIRVTEQQTKRQEPSESVCLQLLAPVNSLMAFSPRLLALRPSIC